MKTTLRVVSALLALMMVCTFAACGNDAPAAPTTAPVASQPTTAATEASVPFVAPPDQIGLVTSADTQLVTWQAYATEEDTIDFKSVDVKTLGQAGEMSLVYLEREVTYYSLVDGKLEKVTVDEVVPGSVIGITTLEEGVMEIYILSVPVEDTGDEDYEDVEDFEEVEIPPTTEPDDYDPSDEVDPGDDL